MVRRLSDVVGEVNEQLRQTALRGRVVAQDWGESRVAEGLREALAKCFACAGVVAESFLRISTRSIGSARLAATHRKKHLTTCFNNLTVC